MTMFSLLDEVRATESWRKLRSKVRSLETLKVSTREHHAIIDAIEAGNAKAASAAMHAHLSTLMTNLGKLVAKPSRIPKPAEPAQA
jgi:DNA-binding GntR family transcriptional regulator